MTENKLNHRQYGTGINPAAFPAGVHKSDAETIAAKSSAPGGSFRGVVRLSGPAALDALRPLVESDWGCPDCRFVHSGTVFPWGRERPVPARLFYWPEDRSYTGRQTVEIHTLGSQPLLDALVAAVCRHDSVRPARPGEFTLQAFLSGRLDLAQAEAVLGIIDAPDDAALRVALDQLAGGMTASLALIREQLLDLLAHLEAGLDFADDEIEFVSAAEMRRVLEESLTRTEKLLQRMESRTLSDKKPCVVLAGPPNVGKSSLFNALAGRAAALVSPQAGTTRDYVEAEITEDGVSFRLWDTAGVDDGQKPVSEIDEAARHTAVELFDRADLVLQCRENEGLFLHENNRRSIFVRTKIDEAMGDKTGESVISVSSKTGQGISVLRREIARRLRSLDRSSEWVPDTAARCRDSLRRTAESIESALGLLDGASGFHDESLVASEIRAALAALAETDGQEYRDDILERIFSRFCIGK